MKRSVFAIGVCIVSLCACSGQSPQTPTPNPQPTPALASSPPPQPASNAPPSTRLQARACSEEPSLRSTDAATLTSIEFQNVSGAERRVYWLNYQGGRQWYNTLQTASSYQQPTYVTHPWVVTDASNTCLGIYLPLTTATSAVLEPGTGTPAVPAATTRPCSDAPQLRSTEATVTTSISFVNQTSGAIKVLWIDYTGQRVLYNTLDRGASYTQPTFVTHPWLVTDASDRCLSIVVPSPQPTRATIQ
jgi:von Hippel-Lindau disease tumor suppressor protein